MATKLGKLRSDLYRLRNTRRLLRWGNGLSLLTNAIVTILVIAFLADWLLLMTPAQRGVLLGLIVIAVVWALRRFTLPWFRQHDDVVELALAVEREQRIDSDLVSALQFERPEAGSWGSQQLEDAVITQVAEQAPKINVFQGLPLADFNRRVLTAFVVFAVVVIGGISQPAWYEAFLSRMLLGADQYPTRTMLRVVGVNGTAQFIHPEIEGKSIDGSPPLKTQDDVASPFGHPLVFMVLATGELPASRTGVVRITSLDGDIATEIELAQQKNAPNIREAGDVAVYTGELPRLMDSVRYQVFLGDARSRRYQVDAIPLPVIDLDITVTPPDYAAAAMPKPDGSASSMRQLSVVEGSHIDLSVKCLNKQLASATLWLSESDEPYKLTPQDGLKNVWTLDTTGTPLRDISEPLSYRIEVTDDQGLKLESPIHGTIRLRTDQPPRTAVSVRTRRVIPAATPPIKWSASDDFGLERVVAEVQVARADGEIEEDELSVAGRGEDGKAPTSLDGEYRLDLSAFKLVKGDELKVTFVAYDFRGESDSQRSFSEPVIFQVTDRQGILSGLLETDEESAKQLDAIIRRELGIGETR